MVKGLTQMGPIMSYYDNFYCHSFQGTHVVGDDHVEQLVVGQTNIVSGPR